MGREHLIQRAAAVGFDRTAADYERGRPGYPAAVVDLLRAAAALGPGRKVCDLAAGTGKFTRMLVEAGADVVAIEPVKGMRTQLAEAVPGVPALDGTAERIPLPDTSIDLVTVAQAFHWFRVDEALGEVRRVLRPGGHLAILWNRRDESVAWVAEMSRVVDWHNRPISSYQRTDWAAVLTGGGFAPVQYREISWSQPMTRDLLAARVRSISYIGEMAASEQQGYVDRVLALVEDFPDDFELPYTTMLWWATAG